MIHPIHQKYAKLLVEYCTNIQANEKVAVNVAIPALPMARALYREILSLGAHPFLRLSHPELERDFLDLAQDIHLDSEPTFEISEIKQLDVWIRVSAPSNNKMLQNSDKEKFSRYMKRMRPVQQIRLGKTKWCGTLYPTEAGAQDASMSLDEYENFVYNAMFLFDEDPIAKWQEIESFQDKLINRLKIVDKVRIVAEGTDLTLSVKDRIWINSPGRKNMPSGEVFTAPIENSANGVITYTIPSSVHGVEVENVHLKFENGQVVEAKAEKGDDLLQAQLNTDKGSRFLGEIGIGTNYNIQRPTKSILYDEKIGGTVHLAVGQAYSESGGVNESAVHWDMICDLRQGGIIYIDGEVLQENGKFKEL